MFPCDGSPRVSSRGGAWAGMGSRPEDSGRCWPPHCHVEPLMGGVLELAGGYEVVARASHFHFPNC